MPATATAEAVQDLVFRSLVEFGADEALVERDAAFADLDIDSLDLAELGQIVDDAFGVQLKGADVRELETVGQAVDLIVARAG